MTRQPVHAMRVMHLCAGCLQTLTRTVKLISEAEAAATLTPTNKQVSATPLLLW